VDGWFELHKKFGTMSMEHLLQPAINYARNGFPVSQIISDGWNGNAKNFEHYFQSGRLPEINNFRDTFLVNGKAPSEGQVFKNPYLAQTLEIIAKQGRDAFYNGPLTDIMVEYLKTHGSRFCKEDFASHKSTWEVPLSTNYRGYDVHELAPNGQGLAALQMLNILENFDLRSMGYHSADFLHVCVEAKRLAWADRDKYYTDPAFCKIPLKELNSKQYGKERAKLINMEKVADTVHAGIPSLEIGDTIYMTVADKDGMMVSLIQSNFRGMGSGMVPPKLGFCFHNRGELFSMEKNHANVYAPGKRPLQTIIPAFVTKNNIPFLSFGVMGGPMQPQGHVQILVNMIDFGMDVQAAGDAARWYHFFDNDHTGEKYSHGHYLSLEKAIPEDVKKELEKRGHILQYAKGNFGGYQAIQWNDEHKVYHGASEMRKDGQAAGY
jgi:gamma-glutamyltranspeptidase/glutathione hydrolase